MRYLVFTKTHLPNKTTVLAESFANRIKLFHEQTAQIILDFKTKTVTKTNLDTQDWDETIELLWPNHQNMLNLMYEVHKMESPYKPPEFNEAEMLESVNNYFKKDDSSI